MRRNLFDFLLEEHHEDQSRTEKEGRLKKMEIEKDYFELDLHFKKPPIENYAKLTTSGKISLHELPVYRSFGLS